MVYRTIQAIQPKLSFRTAYCYYLSTHFSSPPGASQSNWPFVLSGFFLSQGQTGRLSDNYRLTDRPTDTTGHEIKRAKNELLATPSHFPDLTNFFLWKLLTLLIFSLPHRR